MSTGKLGLILCAVVFCLNQGGSANAVGVIVTQLSNNVSDHGGFVSTKPLVLGDELVEIGVNDRRGRTEI